MQTYTRKDIVKIFGITLLTVISWENKGKLSPKKDRNGLVLYDFTEVILLVNKEISKLENALKRLNDKKDEILNKSLDL